MISKRTRDISRIIRYGHDGPSGPTQAVVDALHDAIQMGTKWLEELAEMDIQSRQRWFEVRTHGIMTVRETVRYGNLRTADHFLAFLGDPYVQCYC